MARTSEYLRVWALCGALHKAHARRKFDELIKENQSPVTAQAAQRIAWLYRIEKEARELPEHECLSMRQARGKPLCEELHVWLRLERQRVPDGSAIDYSLNRWTALTAYLFDGNVAIMRRPSHPSE